MVGSAITKPITTKNLSAFSSIRPAVVPSYAFHLKSIRYPIGLLRERRGGGRLPKVRGRGAWAWGPEVLGGGGWVGRWWGLWVPQHMPQNDPHVALFPSGGGGGGCRGLGQGGGGGRGGGGMKAE